MILHRLQAEFRKRLKNPPGRIGSKNFDRIRKAHEGRFIRGLNSPENISHSFIPLYFKGVNFFEQTKVYKELTIQDVQKVFSEHFSMTPALSVIWPMKM